LPIHFPPEDLASVLLTRRARDASFEAVVERALHAFARIVPRACALELVAREPRRARDPAAGVEALKEILGPRFREGWHAEDEEGNVHVAVIRDGRARASLGLQRRRVRRDLRIDTIRIDVADGRIIVRTDEPRLERPYADAIGLALFGDAAFFTDAPAYTFKPVVQLGSEALASRRPPGIGRLRVVDFVWDDGEGSTLTAHGSDALAAYEKRGGQSGGYVTGGMYRLDAIEVPRPLDVAIRLPHRAHYRSARHERLARAALKKVGAFAPGSIADDVHTLAPWLHAEWRWRRVLGDALFLLFCERGILVPATTRMVGSAETGRYGWNYVSFDLKCEPGKKYAVAMDPALRSRDLDPAELRMWRLDLDAVKRALAFELTTEPAEPDPAIEGRALDLGVVQGTGLALRIFALLRAPGRQAKELASAMLRVAGTAHVVVLHPEGKPLGCGVEIGLSSRELLGEGGIAAKVFARVAEKKGLSRGFLEPWKLAGADVRFVGEDESGRIWLDRQELVIAAAGAKLLLETARGAGAPVKTSVLAQLVSPNRSDDGVVRQTVPKLGGWIREAFGGAGKVAPEDADRLVEFVPNKGWRMTVKCEVR
jgi:hypothetical protein